MNKICTCCNNYITQEFLALTFLVFIDILFFLVTLLRLFYYFKYLNNTRYNEEKLTSTLNKEYVQGGQFQLKPTRLFLTLL